MNNPTHSKVSFKAYEQHQSLLFPSSLDEWIPKNHLVRVISSVIDQMELDSVLKSYPGGGAPSYHPKMMLKVLIYAYTQKIYSSRQIAKALVEQIPFRWLSGGNLPDFRTINRYRSTRLKGTIEDVFTAVVELLFREGIIDLKDYFMDGTKFEANANKYSFVWGKATAKFKARLQRDVKALFEQIDQVNASDDDRYGDKDLPGMGGDDPIDSAKIQQTVERLNARLQKEPSNKDLKKAVKKLKDDYLPRQQKYEQQEKILGERNSYSKTDEDATFMRMKEDHMLNGQLKPGYNVQIGTHNQFILGYSIHQKPSDSTLLIPHLEWLKCRFGKLPGAVTADAGYGSEENYAWLDDEQVTAYVKYNNFHWEQKRKQRNNPYRIENLPYDEKTDRYLCPGGQYLTYLKTEKQMSANGYASERRVYEASGCKGCVLKDKCHKSKGNRRIQVGVKLQEYRKKARELLLSPEGLEHRSRRPIEPEAVFGQIKWNRQFKRFLLRGLDKVTIEFGLVAIAHNLMKLWQLIMNLLLQAEIILSGRAILVARNLILRKPAAFLEIRVNSCQSVAK